MDASGRLRQQLFPLEPDYRERVWGGQRLHAANPPIGEAWIAFGDSRVKLGREAGRTVGELAAEHPAELLGDEVAARTGARFPILLKLLDCAGWLSVQVHPNDEQARRLVGPDEYGKTEGWFVLDADPGARILAGVKAGTTKEALAASIRNGSVLDVTAEVPVRAGEAIFIPAGMLHALGPGLLLYEIQQASDTTYRVYDWGRPASAGRALHIEESAECAEPFPAPEPEPLADPAPGGAATVMLCPYFELEVLVAGEAALVADTGCRSMHVLTVVEGAAEIAGGDEIVRLDRFETTLIAGGAGRYEVRGVGGATRILRASVPAMTGAGTGA